MKITGSPAFYVKLKTVDAMKKLILFFVLCFSGTAVISAQNIEENAAVREALDKMLEHLDKTKVPTGLLLDYAFDLVDFDRYDGSALTDSNYVERTTFECLLRSIRSSAVGTKPFGDVGSIMDEMSRNNGNTLNVGLLLFKYNYIREDALDNNLIIYENDQVYDSYGSDGKWRNPYAEKYVIGFSSYNFASFSSVTSFSFPSDFIFSNAGIVKMEFDPGDGSGYRRISAGSTVSASYQEGAAELKMRVTLEDGEVLTCHSRLICDPEGIKLEGLPSIDDDACIPGKVESFSHTSGGAVISARASVFYAKSNSSQSIKKPFVVVEGFDPVDLCTVGEQLGISLKSASGTGYYDSGFTTARSYYSGVLYSDSGIADIYDVIYVDWMNSEADIRDNARLLMKIIDWVNAEKITAGSEEPNVVLGESMGGLVVRYALRTMELEGKPHETTVYISHDSPHLGAHIPLGALYGIYGLMQYYYNGGLGFDIMKIVLKTDSAAYALRKYLYSVSARQMLVNHVNSSGMLDNRVHEDWQNELSGIGFPSGDSGCSITNLAVVNGGVVEPPIRRPYLTADGKVYTSGVTDLAGGLISDLCAILLGVNTNFWDRLPGKTTLSCHAEINPYFSYGTKIFDMNIGYDKRVLWLFKKHINIFSMTRYAPSSGLMYDGFPGSIYEYNPDGEDFGGGDGHWLVGGYGYSVDMHDGQFMFIPTASALCYGKGQSLSGADYNKSFYASLPKPLVEMPFHGALLKQDASGHIHSLAGMYDWIRQQVAVKIDGPAIPVTGDRYILTDCPYPVTWSSSAPSVVAINSTTGAVTVKGAGCVTITAKYVAGGQEFSKTKSVMAGFPELYLELYFDKMAGYTTEAKCRSGKEVVDAFIATGDIVYEWGLKEGEDPIRWHTSSSPAYVTGLTKRKVTTTVYVRLKSKNGAKGKTYNKVIDFMGKAFYVRPKYFIINELGELYAFDPKTYAVLMGPNDLPPKICYSIYTHDPVDFSLPRRVVVNGNHQCHWTDWPQPDTSVWMWFTICSEDELYDALNRMKPRGDEEQIIFWVSAYDNYDVEIHLQPIYMLYKENVKEGDMFLYDELP